MNGVPGCANHFTETEILKERWGFEGFIESDYTATKLRACPPVEPDEGPCGHGIAADGPEAARAALEAGTDSEMVSTNYLDFGEQLLEEGKLSMSRVDEDAVQQILTVKFKAGLFDHPYVNIAQIPEKTMQPEDVAAARAAASRSMVLPEKRERRAAALEGLKGPRRGHRANRRRGGTVVIPAFAVGRAQHCCSI